MTNSNTKFKKNNKVVFISEHTPNNLVMNVKRGTYKSSGMEMVTVELPSGLANAFANELRIATNAEVKAGVRQSGAHE
ncbi:hypothetical protein [Acinetobacter tandoii]|uniref:hypothetical protein n=1 Tax=Acinetobacter tandoii TaxID=202954 RepID=UPI003018A23D